MPTWRDMYHDEVARQRDALCLARERGQRRLIVADREVDPARLGDCRIADLARLHAERVVNYAINAENAARRRAGRPDDVIADSITTGAAA